MTAATSLSVTVGGAEGGVSVSLISQDRLLSESKVLANHNETQILFEKRKKLFV